MSRSLLIVAGEASGDLIAADLVRELRKGDPTLGFFGMGGARLGEERVDLLHSASSINIIGISGIISKFPQIRKIFKSLLAAAAVRKPAAAILVDLPEFNLRLARKLSEMGIPVYYYVSPQIWAWRKSRVKIVRRYVKKMIVLLPFEKEFYDNHGVDSVWVGHPLVDEIPKPRSERDRAQRLIAPRIALLPGSRHSEIANHGPLLKEVAINLLNHYPKAQFITPIASTLSQQEVETAMDHPAIQWVGSTARALSVADVAIVASGTATLETTLWGVPFSLFYKVKPLHGFLYRLIVRYPVLCLTNLLMRKMCVKEFFLEKATVENLVGETRRLLDDEPYRSAQLEALYSCRKVLGDGEVGRRAAETILTGLTSLPTRTAERLSVAIPATQT